MTSEQNKLLPELAPKAVIGIKRRPNRRDLLTRRDPDSRLPLQGLPDPSPSAARHRTALELEQTELHLTQALLDAEPSSAVRDSLTVLADPDWATEAPSSPELEDDEARAVEDAFIARASGVGVEKVMLTRAAPVYPDARAFVERRAREREEADKAAAPGVAGRRARAGRRAAAAVEAPAVVGTGRLSRTAARLAAAEAPAVAAGGKTLSGTAREPTAAEAAALALIRAAGRLATAVETPAFRGNAPVVPVGRSIMQPSITQELTAAGAALALTNEQQGTIVTMEDLRTVRGVENSGDDNDEEDTYRWTVGDVHGRELTAAEAALVLTNVQAGTDVTMQDLKTSRLMVDLWDSEDTFEWTVGNVE